MNWQETLIHAASRRQRVRLVDGRVGVLVYAPGTRSSQSAAQARPVRHGDHTKCGVRFSEATGGVFPVDPAQIIEVLEASDE